MKLPEVRAELRKIQRWHRYVTDRLDVLIHEIDRRPSARTRRSVARRITPEIKRQIREINGTEPHLTQFEIAQRLGVNPGRVSETLRGKRE